VWFHHRPDSPRPASRCRRRSARVAPSLEVLEDRSLPSVAPLPIPGGFLVPNPLGGPDGHFNQPGPADSTVHGVGGEPSSITDFNGFVGVVRVDGTGTDGAGNSFLWEVDLRFMHGVYLGVDGDLHQGDFALI
jgi:hypothetical protein